MLVWEVLRCVRVQKPIHSDALNRMLTKLRAFGIVTARTQRSHGGRPPRAWKLTRAGALLVDLLGTAPRRYDLGYSDLATLAKAVKPLRAAGHFRPKRQVERIDWRQNRHLAA